MSKMNKPSWWDEFLAFAQTEEYVGPKGKHLAAMLAAVGFSQEGE